MPDLRKEQQQADVLRCDLSGRIACLRGNEVSAKTPAALVLRQHGFLWGSALVTRLFDDKRGVTIAVTTPRQTLQVFVTPSGLIRSDKPRKTRGEFKAWNA